MANCIESVLQAFPEADRKDLENIFDAMHKEKKSAFLDAGGNPDKVFREKANRMLENYRRGVMINEIKTLQNIAKSKQLEEFAANPLFKDKGEGIRAKIAGTFKMVEEGRLSVDYDLHANAGMLSEVFLSELEKGGDGLGDIFKSRVLDKEIMMEVEQLAKKEGKPGISGSTEALGIAKAIKKLNDSKLVMMNDAGAFVNKLDGYVMHRSYDSEALKAVGKEQFMKDMLEWTDLDRSFKKDFHTLNAQEVIGGIYDDVIDGKMGIPGSSDSDQAMKMVGTPANMARKLEQGRTIHFKDGMEYEFMQKYGRKSLAEEVMTGISKASRATALMKTFGTNPENAFKQLLVGMEDAEKKRMMRYWADISGATSIPGHSPMAKWLGGARKVVDMSSLGMSVLASLPDIGIRAGTLRASGDSFLSAQLDSITSFFKNIPKASQKSIMHLTSINADAMMGDVFDRFGSSDGAPGMLNKAHQKYFKMIGMRWWTEANMAGTAQMLAAGLGTRAEKSFAQLEPAFGNIMTKYGIGPVEWDALRSTVEREGDVAMVGFSGVRDMPDDVAKKIMEAGGLATDGVDAVGKFKRQTAHKLATYFRDRSDISMNVAGTRERAEVLRRGTTEDTAEGQAMRLMGQFKSFSVTTVTKFADMYKNEVIDQAPGVGAKAASVAPLMVSLTALGYTAMVMKDLIKGNSPKDPTNPKVMMEAMARGGMGGIYGDYLLGEFDSRHGRSALSAMAGPVLGKVDDTMDLYNQLKQAGLEANPNKVKASHILRYVTNIIPGNMPVVRQALDHLFLNQLAESLNPGYNERMKANMAKVGQEPILDGEGNY